MDFCKQFNYGKTHICTRFVQVTGKSVNRYFTELKIRWAKERIRTTTRSFTEISEELGFSSVGYFSKVFKRRMNMSPREYMASVRAESNAQ